MMHPKTISPLHSHLKRLKQDHDDKNNKALTLKNTATKTHLSTLLELHKLHSKRNTKPLPLRSLSRNRKHISSITQTLNNQSAPRSPLTSKHLGLPIKQQQPQYTHLPNNRLLQTRPTLHRKVILLRTTRTPTLPVTSSRGSNTTYTPALKPRSVLPQK
jgi:hypothetical protein